MTEESDKQLDAALESWAQANKPTADKLDQLHARIAQGVRDEAFLEGDVFDESVLADSVSSDDGSLADELLADGAHETTPRKLSGAVWFGFGVAASILVLLLVRISPDTPLDVPLAQQDDPAIAPAPPEGSPEGANTGNDLLRFVGFDADDLGKKTKLFHAAAADFGPQLRWISEAGQDVHLGLHSEDDGFGEAGRPLLLRLVLVAKGPQDDTWKKAWSKDVLARNEAVVEEIPGPGKLRLWCYALPDGLISVETELTLEEPIAGRYVFDSIQKAGTPRRVLSVEIEGVQYELYQTVGLLDQFAGEPQESTTDGRAS